MARTRQTCEMPEVSFPLPFGMAARRFLVRAPLYSVALSFALVVAACGGRGGQGRNVLMASASFSTTAHADRAPCEDRFIPIDLDHETRGPGASQSMFDGMGAGLAVGDLDHDGDEDIVIANLSGDSSLLWNQGALEFGREPLIEGRFRHVVIVDSTGDGLNDVVLTTGVGRPLAMVNTGQGSRAADRFERHELAGLDAYTYTIGRGDLGGDGDLDAVTGAYNAELTVARRLTLGDKGGVGLFENENGAYTHTQLAEESQALAVRIGDINDDGLADILVGNDLATPDYIWFATDKGWEEVSPFSQTAFSTMGFDSGDIDNDGDLDLFATDMKPMDDKPETLSAYEGVIADIDASPDTDNIQIPENVLLVAGEDGYSSAAPSFGIDATGWSWSGLFGDLDNDGFQDLYVVNGMVADNLFNHLPGASLTEPNQAFKNIGGERFEPEYSWALGDRSGGRGMAMADLDNDGDLDIVVNNLNAPARLYENRLCAGRAMTVQLAWEGTGNPMAIGARVIVSGNSGLRLVRTVETSRGYLSGASPTVHFGLGADWDTVDLEVLWPDGRASKFEGISVDQAVFVTRRGGPKP